MSRQGRFRCTWRRCWPSECLGRAARGNASQLTGLSRQPAAALAALAASARPAARLQSEHTPECSIRTSVRSTTPNASIDTSRTFPAITARTFEQRSTAAPDDALHQDRSRGRAVGLYGRLPQATIPSRPPRHGRRCFAGFRPAAANIHGTKRVPRRSRMRDRVSGRRRVRAERRRVRPRPRHRRPATAEVRPAGDRRRGDRPRPFLAATLMKCLVNFSNQP